MYSVTLTTVMRLTITTLFNINNIRERSERRNLLKGSCCEDVISHPFNVNNNINNKTILITNC